MRKGEKGEVIPEFILNSCDILWKFRFPARFPYARTCTLVSKKFGTEWPWKFLFARMYFQIKLRQLEKSRRDGALKQGPYLRLVGPPKNFPLQQVILKLFAYLWSIQALPPSKPLFGFLSPSPLPEILDRYGPALKTTTWIKLRYHLVRKKKKSKHSENAVESEQSSWNCSFFHSSVEFQQV